MTENEIKEATFEDALYCAKTLVGLEMCEECRFNKLCHVWCDDVYRIILDALEEIQQYRAIETELREQYHANVDIKMLMQHFIETIFKGEKHDGFCILTNEDARMWDEYRAIGTIEEFKALKEKNEPKKILYRKQSYGTPWLCPYCEADQVKVEFFCEDGSEPKEKYTFCWQCGTRIDWGE